MRRIEAGEPLLRANDLLGEAPVWDARRQRLYWADIDGKRVHWYEPASHYSSYRVFEYRISAIACTEANDGLICAIDDGFAFLSFETLFTISDDKAEVSVIHRVPMNTAEKRFNEGMVDPAGRFLAGTMGRAHGTHDGRLFSLVQGACAPEPVKTEITCTNGMGWFAGGSQMYFTDSWEKRINILSYDLATGAMSNSKTFVDDLGEEYGWPDGLCLDTEGGVWSARWGAGKVIRLSSSGTIDVVIDFSKAWNITSCVWGGPLMDALYVTTATTNIEGAGPDDRPDGGSLYVVRNLGFTGEERHRYIA